MSLNERERERADPCRPRTECKSLFVANTCLRASLVVESKNIQVSCASRDVRLWGFVFAVSRRFFSSS